MPRCPQIGVSLVFYISWTLHTWEFIVFIQFELQVNLLKITSQALTRTIGTEAVQLVRRVCGWEVFWTLSGNMPPNFRSLATSKLRRLRQLRQLTHRSWRSNAVCFKDNSYIRTGLLQFRTCRCQSAHINNGALQRVQNAAVLLIFLVKPTIIIRTITAFSSGCLLDHYTILFLFKLRSIIHAINHNYIAKPTRKGERHLDNKTLTTHIPACAHWTPLAQHQNCELSSVNAPSRITALTFNIEFSSWTDLLRE